MRPAGLLEPVRWAAFVALALTLQLGGRVPCAAQELPSFELRNWDGRVVSNASLEGVITIVAFTYAKCIFACPMVTFQLRELDLELEAPPNVRYLHVSVNPADDTAEEIVLHFSKHAIDPRLDSRWMFVNGPEDSLGQFLADLGIEVQKKRVEGGYLIEHTILVLVVGPEGETLASFDTYNWDRQEVLNALRISSEMG